MKPFYKQPVLNSPYRVPTRHHALGDDGQPLDQPPIVGRRRSKYMVPVPKGRKQRFRPAVRIRVGGAAFAAKYNASCLRQRHGYKTPNQIRAEQKALETEAATGFKMAR